MRASSLLSAITTVAGAVNARSIWSEAPGNYSDFIRTALPLGNGRLGAMPVGSYGKDVININVDSLWSGGPFEISSYRGGNPNSSVADALPGIREFIFENGFGNVSALLGSNDHYGSYATLGNLTVNLGNITTASAYKRSLDLEAAVYENSFTVDAASYTREAFCSYPDQVCVYHLSSNTTLPSVTIGLENQLASPIPSVSCSSNSVKIRGQTAETIGMIYEARATVIVPNGGKVPDLCDKTGNQVVVPKGSKEVFVVIAAGTNYDSSKGNAQSNYSFKGVDPSAVIQSTISKASAKSYKELKGSHVKDFSSIHQTFRLTLPDPNGSSTRATTDIIAAYTASGDPFLENLLFDYGRYLFLSSSRTGSLPPNLQGLWAEQMYPAWSSDYHANINLQMNHWTVEQTGLGGQTEPLWTYMTNTWLPRGSETALLLYGTDKGWVTHNEMNIFGHTAMKSDAQWANFPATNVWMCQHVWDHFDYTQDFAWYQAVGYPVIKSAAQFWLSQLVEDKHFGDGTYVANPCNSPEHGNTTFGCTLYQQAIWETLDHIIRGWSASGDSDTSFRAAVQKMLSHLDNGVHVGSWGQIQEWKMDVDTKNDTHRHLSNLYGWYPGYSISAVHGNNKTITDAVATTLYSRGVGIQDSNAGWEKVWRGACWALLNATDEAYSELKLAVQNNFVGNGLSMYSGHNTPFQIDANFGITGNVMAMLIRDLDRASNDNSPQKVILGPAIPASWGNGKVEGVRLRGGGSVSFGWDASGLVNSCHADQGKRAGSAPKLQFYTRGGNTIQC